MITALSLFVSTGSENNVISSESSYNFTKAFIVASLIFALIARNKIYSAAKKCVNEIKFFYYERKAIHLYEKTPTIQTFRMAGNFADKALAIKPNRANLQELKKIVKGVIEFMKHNALQEAAISENRQLFNEEKTKIGKESWITEALEGSL